MVGLLALAVLKSTFDTIHRTVDWLSVSGSRGEFVDGLFNNFAI